MGTINFTYSYDDAEDTSVYSELKLKRIMSIDNCYLALHKYENLLRSKLKYGELSKKEYAVLENARTQFFSTLAEYGVNIDDLE